MKTFGLAFVTVCAASAAVAWATGAAPVIGTGSYGQELVNRVVHQHHNVTALTVYVTPSGARAAQAVAASDGTTGQPASQAAVEALTHWREYFVYQPGHLMAALPLPDMSGKKAGAITLTLSGRNRHALEREAEAIRTYLSRNTSYAANLVQKALWDPRLPLNSYAQQLVDETLARHPDVLILAIHATTPLNADPEILGSNIGRIGKPADSDDMRVVRDGKTNLEINTSLDRYEVELPLKDASGARIGALGVVFVLPPHADLKAKHREAIRIRNALARRIPSAAALVRRVR